MNCRNKFKLTTIAMMVGSSMSANAALYNIYEYATSEGDEVKTYGVAISPSVGTESCWNTDPGTDCDPNKYPIAVEVKRYGSEGFSYRSEVPFDISNGFEYLAQGSEGFQSYCARYLGYNDSFCFGSWLKSEYSEGYKYESDGNIDNSIAYVEDVSGVLYPERNTIISHLDSKRIATGNYNTGLVRNQAFSGDLNLSDPENRTQAFARLTVVNTLPEGETTTTYVVGSVSTQNTSNRSYWSSKATFWKFDEKNTTPSETISYLWNGGSAFDNQRTSNGSIRDLVEIKGTVYGVGYNSNSNEKPLASVFNLTLEDPESYRLLPDLENHANSILYSVNENKIAVGTAKYRSDSGTGFNKAYPDRLFYVSDIEKNLGYNFVTDNNVFFAGASTKVGSINNFNELVGSVDFERHAEIEGKPRAQRAFITTLLPDKLEGKSRYQDIYRSRSWYLDDLTNGDNAAKDNNQYRIIDATDINDAGVISGTAQKCDGGYSTTAHQATCDGEEYIVAVKLVPINGATASDIRERSYEVQSTARQGAGLGWLALTILGLIGFRRKY